MSSPYTAKEVRTPAKTTGIDYPQHGCFELNSSLFLITGLRIVKDQSGTSVHMHRSVYMHGCARLKMQTLKRQNLYIAINVFKYRAKAYGLVIDPLLAMMTVRKLAKSKISFLCN